MSDQLSSSHFRSLLGTALQNYERQTGTKLDDHPLFQRVKACDSVESITAVLREQARALHEFRGDDGKVMKSLKCAVDILNTLSTSTVLGEGIGLPFPPAKAIFAGIAILLGAVKNVSASYDALVDLFESIESFLNRLDIYTRIPPTAAMTDIIVKIMVELLSTLALATKQVKQGRLKKFVKKLLGENDIEAVLQRLDRLTLDEARATGAQTLEVVYSLVQYRRVVMDDVDSEASADGVRGALETMQQIASSMNKSERDKLQRDIRQWLSPPDPWKNHNIARESQHSGTATWWIKGDTFAEWKSSGPSSLLWIHGKPGAGKSVLCSSIIQDVRTMAASGLASVAFFYCDFRDNQKKDRHGLISSLLGQLCDQSDAYSTILSHFYSAHGDGSQHASDDGLVECLKDMLKLPGQATIYIIIDALDECPKTTGMPSPRDKVVEFVEELVSLRLPHMRICVTSRPEADIVSVLDPLAFRSVSLHGEGGQIQDIAEYVKSTVRTDPMIRRWKAADKQLVIDVLTTKADGMFRWAFCQLVYLRHCLPGRIRRALDELPQTLDQTYDRTLEDIGDQNWEYAQRLFQCVAAASRPLRVEELAEFLAFDFDTDTESTPTFLEEWRPEDPGQAVLYTCSSLLAIVKVDNVRIIQFTHFSVKEYLTSERLGQANHTVSRFHVSMTAAHAIVAQACLGALLHLGEDVNKDILEAFPLAEYAAEHWVAHARFEDVAPPTTQDGMKRLFDPKRRHLAIWVWIYDPADPRRPSEQRSERPSEAAAASALHYAALYGIHDVVQFLVVERRQDVNERGLRLEETPLGVASRMGHSAVARVLLEHGADTEVRDRWSWSPLDQASRSGHAHVARVLLQHGARANTGDVNISPPLHVASASGQAAAARVLLEHGADVDGRNIHGHTPLHWASGEGVARVLLEYGADVDALDVDDKTPFEMASERGRADITQVLLEHEEQRMRSLDTWGPCVCS